MNSGAFSSRTERWTRVTKAAERRPSRKESPIKSKLVEETFMIELNFPDKFIKTYRKDEVICHEGDPGSHMYVISSGRVDITRCVNGSPETVATLGNGEVFGEMALIDSLPRSATAVSAEDDTRVHEIDHALFVYLVGQQPAFALIILKALSLRLRAKGIPEKLSVDVPEGRDKNTAADNNNGVVQLKENIFQFRGKCMAYLIRGARKNLLIDTGLPWEKDLLEKQLNSAGIAKEDVHIVVLTHEHLDHIGCVPVFSPRTVIAAHSMAANKIGMQDEFVLMSKSFHLNVADYHIDFHLHQGTTIDLGGTVLQVLHTPGHSSGSICLYEPNQQVLFTGDTIFANGVLGGIFPSGSISDYALTLRQLSMLRVRELYPGHGRISTTPEEDFAKAIKGSLSLVHDTRSLFNVLDSQAEFAQVSKAVSTYAKRV
jgi:hydroxyacylglutathione hydrolase